MKEKESEGKVVMKGGKRRRKRGVEKNEEGEKLAESKTEGKQNEKEEK